jgi:hypothetical protein
MENSLKKQGRTKHQSGEKHRPMHIDGSAALNRIPMLPVETDIGCCHLATAVFSVLPLSFCSFLKTGNTSRRPPATVFAPIQYHASLAPAD